MDLGAAQLLAASTDPKGVRGLLQHSSDPAAAKAVAQQFSALFMQSLMQQNDGSALPMADGTGGNIVNTMFASTIGQKVAAGEKLGLADLLLRSIQAKQQQAGGASAANAASAATTATGPATAVAPGATAAAVTPPGLPLSPYWLGNGMRPLAAAVTNRAQLTALAAAAHATAAVQQVSYGMMLPQAAAAAPSVPATAGANQAASTAAPTEIGTFTQQLLPLLEKAGRQLGVSPRILLAQAAIETGWGRSVVGNNIFGIKAGSSWTGATVNAATHEYENGQYVAIHDAFRSYPSLDAAVQDFVSLVSNSSRYRAALGAGDDVGAYAHALLAGGWATDIDYVHKLEAVANGRTVAAAIAPAGVPAAAVPASPGPPIKLIAS